MSDRHQPTRGRPRVALVTCGELPDLDPDDRLLRRPLAARGVTTEAVAWDAPGVDWAGYDLAVIRSTWDYATRRDEFVAWAATVPRLANPADVIAWNTDKRYLGELSAAGLPTVPTTWVAPGRPWAPPGSGEYVVKPAVSAGSLDTGRYDLADPEHRRLALAHLARLGAAGRLAMVQPYLSAVDTAGETALLYVIGPDGPTFSHAIRKGPMLTGPDQGVDGLYRTETIDRRAATPAQRAVAERVLAAVPGGARRLLYARVDLIPGAGGAPVLVELELTEPSLFLGHAEGAAERLADAIVAHLTATA
ncbi:hypothetical protein O7606_01735 [Micromonospora sp. WMMD882]|uniref:ATP-grasp domain-containing protein n=1 Tax=Micromonospora sp. WMMD882 TaxID=3015151 RepID=UPI00248B9A1D|nr:hypothetical protein [Micromonospora sp. WMMD882]WBB80140.1 hypothetical protein O7606_01735 [Micromonospora sp. WMMD882]